jgi:hypothetical protein
MTKAIFQFCLFFLISYPSIGQSPISIFDLEDSVCLKQDVNLVNLSSNTNSYVWDFCMNDLIDAPDLSSTFEIESSSFTSNIDVVYDSGNWYGFVTDFLSNMLYKLDYGNSLSNNPVLIEFNPLS